MKIIYVHHALRKVKKMHTQDDDITFLGTQEAKITAKILMKLKKEGLNIKAIYTSPFKRCLKTSLILNKKLKVDMVQDPRLNEFKWEDKNESWTNCQNRMSEVIRDIVTTFNDDETVVCVTSGVNVIGFINVVCKLKSREEAPFIGVAGTSPLIFKISKDHFK